MIACKPYSLQSERGSSDEYYRVIAGFTDRWLSSAHDSLARPVSGFLAFLNKDRSFAEAAFEMLVLGVLLREHGVQALQLPAAPAWLLARLIEAQERLPLPAIEKPIKTMRGLVQGFAASDPFDEANADMLVDELPFGQGAAGVVARLVDWLDAEGMTAQSERLAQWRDFFAQLSCQYAEVLLARCLLLAEDFAAESEVVLGPYTAEVSRFVTCVQPGARWRYDAGLITRTRVEYHLGMLGTEILSRAYRARFQAMPRKVVVVPDCLCAHSRRAVSTDGESCQAARTSLGGRCQGCAPGCKVHGLTRLGEKRGFEVYILPDEMRGIGLSSCSRLEGVGVVGVSCALTNWDAGWQVAAGGVPAQGVLLDYAGCKSHWSDQGITTDVNVRKLLEMVGGRE